MKPGNKLTLITVISSNDVIAYAQLTMIDAQTNKCEITEYQPARTARQLVKTGSELSSKHHIEVHSSPDTITASFF